MGGWGRQSRFLPRALVPSSLCMHQQQVPGHRIWLKPLLTGLPACGGRGGAVPAQGLRARSRLLEPRGAGAPSPGPAWRGGPGQGCPAPVCSGAGRSCSSTARARTRCSGTRDIGSDSRQFTFPLDCRLLLALDLRCPASSPLQPFSRLQGRAGRDLHSQPPRKS